MGVDELDNLAVAIGRGFAITACLVDHPQTIVSIVDFGIAIQEFTCRLLGLIELAFVYEIDNSVGVAGQLILVIKELTAEVTVVMAVIMMGRLGGAGRCGCRERRTLGGLIFR